MTDFDPQIDPASFDAVRVRELTAAICDDMITSAEVGELEGILLTSASARAQFLEDVCVHAGLEWDIAARGRLESLIESCRQADSPGAESRLVSPRSARRELEFGGRARKFVYWGSAAVLLVAAASMLSPEVRERIFGRGGLANVVESGGPSSKGDESSVVIATILPKSDDCRWMFENQSISNDLQDADHAAVRAGETLRVTAGTLQLTYSHGTVVSLAAPAILEIAAPMRGRLMRGRATVEVAPGAEGFTVDTPRTSVVDFGTVFGVEVDDFGRTDVVVFSGIVDITYSSDAQQAANAELGKQRLYMGEAVHVDERGTLSRIVSLNSNRFGARAGSPAARSRKSVIAAVRDNIEREDAWNFYEIVQEGFGEDAKAWVDRVHHEWNGRDNSGMPAYLVGGDYVKSFNDDKNIGTIEVSVKLAQPATLYVLWCKRVPAPSWLRDEFEETGDEIGVDEGRHVFRDGTVHNRDGPRTGAGESIDSIHTIWRRAVPKPTTVQLGPVEAPGWDFNMYGIVAVPLADRPQ